MRRQPLTKTFAIVLFILINAMISFSYANTALAVENDGTIDRIQIVTEQINLLKTQTLKLFLEGKIKDLKSTTF